MRYASVRTADGVETITEQEYLLRIFREPADGDQFLPTCCNGAGYVSRFRPLGHFEFGQIEPCRICHPSMPRPEAPVAKKREPWWTK